MGEYERLRCEVRWMRLAAIESMVMIGRVNLGCVVLFPG